MSLKYTVDSLEGLDETTAALYKETEAGYQLDVEGAAPKEKVNEFRSNNIELNNKLNAIEDKLGNIDPEMFSRMSETLTKLTQEDGDKEMTDAIAAGADAVQTLIETRAESRAEAMKTDFESQLNETSTTASKYKSQLEEAKITAELTRLAAEKGVRATAVDDVLLRGKQVFSLNNDGDVVAMKGDEVVYNKDNKPLTIAEYMTELSDTAPHLFESSEGGGAKNSVKTGGAKGETFTYRGKEHKF